jgi:hypothetical protein
VNDGDTTGRDADLRAGVRIPRLRGVRRSSPFGANVVADSVRRTDPALADRTRAATSWRREYLTPFRRSTALAVSAPASLRIAEDGLAAVRERGVLVTGDGAEEPVGAWCARAAGDDAPPDGGLGTATVTGSAEPLRRVEVPYRGALLAGTALEQQLDRWVVGGAMEPGFADAVRRAMDHPAWLSLPGHQAVLLGAGAALGPLPWLSRWGADVTAVDVGEPAVWERLRRVAADGAGRLAAPVVGAGTPGAHLAADLAALRALTRAGLAVRGFAITTGSVHVLSSSSAEVELRVSDTLSGYALVGADGRVARRVAPRPPRAFIVWLAREDGEWRIARLSR